MTTSTDSQDSLPRVHLQRVRDTETTLKVSIDVIDPIVASVLNEYTVVRMPDDVVHVYKDTTHIASNYGLNQGRKFLVVLRQLAYTLL